MDLLVFGACFAIIAAASKQIGQSLVKTGLPLISGFLLTGIVAGPYVLDLISIDAILNLRFIDEISLEDIEDPFDFSTSFNFLIFISNRIIAFLFCYKMGWMGRD